MGLSFFGVCVGLTLRSGDIGDAAEAWPVAILGLVWHLTFLHAFKLFVGSFFKILFFSPDIYLEWENFGR